MEVRQDMKREVDLIQRFAGAYRQRFAQLIDRLNGSTPAVSDLQCLRLCVEAVDMILSSQSQLAQAISQIADSNGPPPSMAGTSRPTRRPAQAA
jgi:hypothetical protein